MGMCQGSEPRPQLEGLCSGLLGSKKLKNDNITSPCFVGEGKGADWPKFAEPPPPPPRSHVSILHVSTSGSAYTRFTHR